MNVDWLLVARDGAILALGACTLIAALLRLNPRLFLRHFPEEIRRTLPPKTSTEKRHSMIGGIALLAWTLGVLIMSAAAAESRGTADFLSLAFHTFAVGMVFNLAFEHARHFQAFVRGSIMFAVIGAAIALGVWLI